jgi:hypothetical protein
MMLAFAQEMILQPLEGRQYIVIAPAGEAKLGSASVRNIQSERGLPMAKR